MMRAMRMGSKLMDIAGVGMMRKFSSQDRSFVPLISKMMLKLNRIYEIVNRYVKGQFGIKVLANTLVHAMTNTPHHPQIIGIIIRTGIMTIIGTTGMMTIIGITGIMTIMEMMNNEMIHGIYLSKMSAKEPNGVFLIMNMVLLITILSKTVIRSALIVAVVINWILVIF